MSNAYEKRDGMYDSISGLKQSDREMSYEIETADVKKFVQKRFTRVDDSLKQQGLIRDGDEVEIDLISLEPEKTFIPFALILPVSVLDRPTRRNRPSIFEPDHSDGVRIKPYYYELFKPFMFDKEDARAFRSNVWRNAHRIKSYKTTNMLHRYSTPKIMGQTNDYDAVYENDDAKVIVILDPVRIFHAMLKFRSNMRQEFSVFIKQPVRIDSVNYHYTVKRVVNTKKRNRDDLENKIKKYLFES